MFKFVAFIIGTSGEILLSIPNVCGAYACVMHMLNKKSSRSILDLTAYSRKKVHIRIRAGREVAGGFFFSPKPTLFVGSDLMDKI